MSEIAVAMTTEIEPPPEGKKSRKPRKKTAGPPRIKHGVVRPYRSLQADVLANRIAKLTTRLEKAKKQHEATRHLLTKYAHERFYRDKEALEAAQPDLAPPGPPSLQNDIDPPASV